ncbi:methyltransferase [Photorhabdus laumondii]|uniref:methyltransferase n=1 Tax=Photorhabdus laumondii TaxID=2218628 RepID=UPI002F42C90F
MKDNGYTDIKDGSMLTELIASNRRSAAIHAFVDTGLSTHFKDGIYVDISELSRKSGVNYARFSRLCDFLVEMGVLVSNDNKFRLSDECHVFANPESFESFMIKLEICSHYSNAWLMYGKSLFEDDGKSAFEMAHGRPFFEYLDGNKFLKSNFDALMTRVSNLIVEKLLGIYDFNQHNRILDVGGGEGELLVRISEKVKGKHYAVLDRYSELPVSDNIDFINGNFLNSIPSGYDLYILKNVLHNWSDSDSILILENFRKAMDKNSSLLLINMVKEPEFSRSFDILMDVLFLGKERSFTEFEYLANQAGLVVQETKVIDQSYSPYSFIKLQIK